MPNYIKVKTGSSSWSTATKAYVKKSTGWVQPIRIWMRLLSGWTRIWPTSGPFAETSPYIVSTASGSTHLLPTAPLRIGTTYYGRNGVWNANGWTISSYNYQWRRYSLQSAADDSGQTNRLSGTFASPSIAYTPVAADDKKYLSFQISPVTTDTFEISEAESGDDDGRLFAITQIPLGTPGSLTAAPKVGTVINFSSSWDTSNARQIETSRSMVAWYKNTTASFTGATLIKNNLGSVSGAYSYTPVTADQNNYIIVRETAFNSGSDYADGVLTLANTAGSGTEVGVTIQAISGLVTSALAAPTISSITVSSIGGPVSVSFAGGSGPFYQIFWWGTATAPTGLTTADASGTSSPLTDNTGPTSTATQYMYVRSTSTQSDTGVANGTTISAWSDGVQFNMTSASALTPTFGTNTSTANGFTGSVTNYDSAYNWNTPSTLSFTLTNGTWAWGTASGATRPFTVTGLSASQSSTATVTTTRPDYASGSNSITGTASALPQYTVTWGANGGTGGGSTGPFNSGVAHTAPSPGTREGFTFANYRYPASGGTDPVFVLSGGSYTPTGNTTFGAQWTANVRATGAMRRVTMPVSFTNSSQSIWVGTNGYVSTTIDPASSTIGTTWPPAGGVVVGPAVADMKQVSLFTLADASNYYVRWRGHGFSEAATTVTLDYLMKFYWNSTTVDVYFITNSTTASLSSSSIYYGGTSYALWDNSTLISGMAIPAGLVENTTLAAETDDNRTAITATKPALNLTTSPAYGTATSTSGGWTASITTAANPSGGTYSVVSQTAGSASVNSSTGALTASGLTSGQSSTVTVRYSLSGYNSVDITKTGSAVAVAVATKLGTPTGVSASRTYTDKIRISWSAVSNASTYGVWYRGAAPVYDNAPDFATTSNLYLDDTSVSSGAERQYDVQAYPASGSTLYLKSDWGGPSNAGLRAATVTPATAPGIPGTPTNGWTSGLSYPFSWTAATPGTVSGGGAATISSYQIRIYRASDSAGTGSALYNTYTSTGSGVTYSFTAPDGLYYAASVSATNSAGLTSSSYSGISAYK